jgi:3-hydroxybutyrate dehydrogenase
MSAKVAVITGSISGIGLGMAKRFAANGYNIMFNGLVRSDEDQKQAERVAEEVATEFGVMTKFNGANMMDPDAIRALIKDAEDSFGHIDVLVNNAGIQFVSPIEDFPDDRYKAIIDINMNAAFYAIKAAFPKMKERKFGRIINLTSAHALRASEGKIAYVTSKHGVTGMTKVVALEGADFNITCNAICPGYVKTPLVEGQIADQAKLHGLPVEEVISKVILKKQAVKDFVTVEYLGDMAVFLASPNANMISGASIPVDGAWTVQ